MGRDFAASSKPPRPGASSFGRLISDAYLFSRLAARSRAAAVRHRLRPRDSCRVPPRAPQRVASPNQPARRLPRHGALGRALQPIRRSQSSANTEAPFRFASRIFCENQAAKPQRMKSHARRFATGTQSCAASPARFSLVVSNATDNPFSFCRRDFTSAGQDIARCAALQLDRLRLDLFGQNEKILSWLGRLSCIIYATAQLRAMLAVYIQVEGHVT